MSDEDLIRDLERPSPVVAVVFGGLAMRMEGIPPFEFFRILGAAAPTKRLFVRDRNRCWYQRGVAGVAEDIEGVAEALRLLIAESGASRVVTLGASAGGYAALLFGRLLGAGEVHAFAPQTFISPELRSRFGDSRWPAEMAALSESGAYRPAFGDLRRVFEQAPPRGGRFVLHYCPEDELDTIHARHLASEAGVELREHAEGGHYIARSLRQSGDLLPLLSEALLSAAPAPPWPRGPGRS